MRLEPRDVIAFSAIVVSLLGVVASVVIAFVNLSFARQRERVLERREDWAREIERSYVPRTEFQLDCRFHGPEPGIEGPAYVTEVSITVHNKGKARRKFSSIRIRVRGIKRGVPLKYWGYGRKRIEFPGSNILLDDFIPQGREEYYFIEPGVKQEFVYPTIIGEDIKYILVHVRLEALIEYDSSGKSYEDPNDRVFTGERIFKVAATHDDAKKGDGADLPKSRSGFR